MIKKILIGLGAVVGLVLVIAALQPADFAISRGILISAPTDIVFNQLNDFHNWTNWSPWEKMDPSMTRSYEGPPAGPGAKYSWKGNDKVGEGRMTILESETPKLIRIQLDFIKPFEATNLTEFAIVDHAGQAAVTWTMSGKRNFISKVFCLFMNMGKMVGGDFEKGLAAIKALAEKK